MKVSITIMIPKSKNEEAKYHVGSEGCLTRKGIV